MTEFHCKALKKRLCLRIKKGMRGGGLYVIYMSDCCLPLRGALRRRGGAGWAAGLHGASRAVQTAAHLCVEASVFIQKRLRSKTYGGVYAAGL